MRFLSIYGHIIVDAIIESSKIPDNEEFIGIDDFEIRYGGTGANLAMAAARLGVPVSLASFVGTDFPGNYWERLESAGIDLSGVVRKEGKSPRVWIINTPNGQRGLVYQGVMANMGNYELLYEPAMESKWVHLSTGRPEYYYKIGKEAKSQGKRIAFDPSQEIHYVYSEETLRNMLSISDIFFCNESELSKALGMLGLKDEGELLDSVPIIVNTLGEKGSRIITEKGEERIPAMKPARFTDQTGAGDAYRAGFYAGLYHNLSPYESGLVGSAVSSFVIENRGAQDFLPTLDMVRKRLETGGYEVSL